MYEKPGEAAVHGLKVQPLLRYRSRSRIWLSHIASSYFNLVAYLLLPCVFQGVEVKFTVGGVYYSRGRLVLSLHLSVRKRGASSGHHG